MSAGGAVSGSTPLCSPMIKRPSLMLVDAMSQVFRAYYAIRGLTNSKGLPTNATYGFALMVNRVLEKFPPDYVAMVFDSSVPTHRHERYPEYKANREKMPPDLAEQIPYIKQFCEAMRIPMLEVPGQEADDVIGTLARRAPREGLHPVIVTLDKDMMQLVTADTLVLNTSKDDRIIGPDEVQELFGVTPDQIIDLLGLWGDSADNVPGAPGIGEKGARALVERFGSIEACLEHAGEVKARRQRESLIEYREQILLSKELVTINTEVPIEVDWEALKHRHPDGETLVPLLRELDFTTLLKAQLEAGAGTSEDGWETIKADEPPDVGDEFSVWFDEDRAFLWAGEGALYDILVEKAAPLLSDSGKRKILHNAKAAILALCAKGLTLAPPYDDVMLMAYLLDPNSGKYEVADLVRASFGKNLDEEQTDEAAWIHRVHELLRPRIREELEDLYSRIELPLVPVLAEIEENGIMLDVGVLETMSRDMAGELNGLTSRIHELAGEEFNINSPKQLGVVLFEKLNLPPPRKLKKSGQYSTAIEVLEHLAETYELPQRILDFRQRAKFKSTYVDVLPKTIDDEGRLHTSFNQTAAATGRLSSHDPNLQNIPIRTELGRNIRAAFVACEGTTMLSADYSQVELRILAHLSGDDRLIEAFLNGADIHRSTAAEVLDVPADEVTGDQRSRAKAVNFGIVYGQTPFGLAKQLGISRTEAEEFIERYFDRYPRVRNYIENALAEARDNGLTRTLFGRIRQIPEINSRNGTLRNMAERMAINAPVQGSAADLIKLAMIRISEEFRRRKVKTTMVLQVHDELIFEVPRGEESIIDPIREWMSSVADLRVPLVVDAKVGPNWRDLTPV